MSINTNAYVIIKNTAAFTPELRLVTPLAGHPTTDDDWADFATPVDLTGFIIKMELKNIDTDVLIDTFQSPATITIPAGDQGYFYPLKADITTWTEQKAKADVIFQDVDGDGLNDTVLDFYFDIRQGVTSPIV